MNIAIADDYADDSLQAQTLIQSYLDMHHSQLAPTTHFTTFSSAEALLASFVPGKYPIVVLDIYMNELSGMDAAKQIAAMDKTCQIIFLTSSMDYVLEGYSVHAAGYVLKPLRDHEQALFEALSYCMEHIDLDQSRIHVCVENTDVAYLLREVCYIDCSNSRNAQLHIDGQEVLTSSTYSQCWDQIKHDRRFLECYHRVCINMNYIKTMQEDSFLLKNGFSVPISRRKKNEVKQAYLMYLATL